MSDKKWNEMDMLMKALDGSGKKEKGWPGNLGRPPVWDEGKGYGGEDRDHNEMLKRVLHGPYDPHIEKNRAPDWIKGNVKNSAPAPKSGPSPKGGVVKAAVKEVRPPGWKAQNMRELTNAFKEGWQPPARNAAAEAAYRPEDWRPGSFSELSEALKTGWKSPAMMAQDAAAKQKQTGSAAGKTKSAVSTSSPQNAAQKLSGKMNLASSKSANPNGAAMGDKSAPGFANGTLAIPQGANVKDYPGYLGPKKASISPLPKSVSQANTEKSKKPASKPKPYMQKPGGEALTAGNAPEFANGTIIPKRNKIGLTLVRLHSNAVSAASKEYGVDSRLLSSVLYNEQKNLELTEGATDNLKYKLGGDASVGLGQVKAETARKLMAKYPDLAKRFPGAKTRDGLNRTLQQPDANIYFAAAALKDIQELWRPYCKSQEELNGVIATMYHQAPKPLHTNPGFDERGKEILFDMKLFE